MLICARLPVGNLFHSWCWELHLEGPIRWHFQIPDEGSVEVGEQGGLCLNNVTTASDLCAVFTEDKSKRGVILLFEKTPVINQNDTT